MPSLYQKEFNSTFNRDNFTAINGDNQNIYKNKESNNKIELYFKGVSKNEEDPFLKTANFPDNSELIKNETNNNSKSKFPKDVFHSNLKKKFFL